MLDEDTLLTQIILNLIELAEVQQAIKAILEMSSEELHGLSLDIDVLARHLQLPRPSQAQADAAEPPTDRNGADDAAQADAPDAGLT